MSYSYTLTPRQVLTWTDRFDVYNPVMPIPTDAGGLKAVRPYNPVPDIVNMRCQWMNHPDINEYKAPLGRTLSQSPDVLDILDVPPGLPIKDQTYLQCKTRGHPQYGEWFLVMGFGALRIIRGNRKGNYMRVRMKRDTCPPGLEGIPTS